MTALPSLRLILCWACREGCASSQALYLQSLSSFAAFDVRESPKIPIDGLGVHLPSCPAKSAAHHAPAKRYGLIWALGQRRRRRLLPKHTRCTTSTTTSEDMAALSWGDPAGRDCTTASCNKSIWISSCNALTSTFVIAKFSSRIRRYWRNCLMVSSFSAVLIRLAWNFMVFACVLSKQILSLHERSKRYFHQLHVPMQLSGSQCLALKLPTLVNVSKFFRPSSRVGRILQFFKVLMPTMVRHMENFFKHESAVNTSVLFPLMPLTALSNSVHFSQALVLPYFSKWRCAVPFCLAVLNSGGS